MKISHPYLEPLPQGDPPMLAEFDAIIHEEADGQRTTTLATNMLDIRQLIRALMAKRDIPQDSRPLSCYVADREEYTFLSPLSEG
ncbi:hypothetical protein TSUD_127300 [Trifolium subterraneum]|nr:hypothetical protein TSUD_127300 [Trifolium subterraneum]